MNDLEKQVVQISYEEKIGHLSSNLNAVNIIDEVYKLKRPDDVFILSSGHAALALYVVLEKYHNIDARSLFHKHGVHPHRDVQNLIHCSTGSLGMGLTVAVGHALANRDKNVWCLLSDGECGEGSIWESLRFIYENKLDNLHVFVNINGMSACDFLDIEYLLNRLQAFLPTINIRHTNPPQWDFASGILTHYYVLKESDYESIIR
jgi:transketolase